MKIDVHMTIELDPAEWDLGRFDTAHEVRKDVEVYLRTSVPHMALMSEAGAEVLDVTVR